MQSRGLKKNTPGDIHIDLLSKGFHGYVCTFTSNKELMHSLNMTPRRPYEDGVYKKRLISISNDLKYLTWRPISLFS